MFNMFLNQLDRNNDGRYMTFYVTFDMQNFAMYSDCLDLMCLKKRAIVPDSIQCTIAIREKEMRWVSFEEEGGNKQRKLSVTIHSFDDGTSE